MLRLIFIAALLSVNSSCMSQPKVFTAKQQERFVAETALAFYDGCLKDRVEYYLDLEDKGLVLGHVDRSGLHYAAYKCGELFKDYEMLFRSGVILIFDLKFWEDRADCRAIKLAAVELNKALYLRDLIEKSGVYCVDDDMIVDEDGVSL